MSHESPSRENPYLSPQEASQPDAIFHPQNIGTVALKRELGLVTCILLVIGNIIGVGIFMTPGKVAQGLPTAGWVLTAWVIGGLMTTAGALTYAELGAMFPKAGGDYVFLREAFGPLVAFLYGISYSLVTTAGTIALLAIGFPKHLGMDEGTWKSKLLAISIVAVLTLLNYRGVKLGCQRNGCFDIYQNCGHDAPCRFGVCNRARKHLPFHTAFFG